MCEIIHFNDVYNIEGKNPDDPNVPKICGGAPRFRTAMDAYHS